MQYFASVRSALLALLGSILPPRKSASRLRYIRTSDLRAIAARESIRPYASEIHTILPYRNRAVRALVIEIKYHRDPRAFALALPLLKEELVGLMEDTIGRPLLIPVPMHAERKRKRGYNQTELLCEQLALLGFDYAPHALMRHQSGRPQQTLPRKARLENMQGSMRADRALVKDRSCIVLDDVSTTGATLIECRRALKEAGAQATHLIALAG